MSHYSKNDRVTWQEMRVIKKWAKRSVKPSNNKGPAPKGSGKSKSSSHKRSKTNGRLCRQAFRPRRTSEQQIDFGHIWKEGTRKAQTSLSCTQPIQDAVRSWVRSKRTWFGGTERFKPILRFLLGLFWGECLAGMTRHSNGQS